MNCFECDEKLGDMPYYVNSKTGEFFCITCAEKYIKQIIGIE